MPKKFIQRYMPDHKTVRDHRYMQIFGDLLHDPNLWHLNRRSASGAFAVGLFVAFIPIPFQMLLAGGIAIVTRVNLALSVALVWLTNPVTMPPIFYFAYKLGAWLLGRPPHEFKFELSNDWLMAELGASWAPLLLGSFVLATVSALLGFAIVRGLWRMRLVRHAQRKKRARARREQTHAG
jgi:uncharacterized protein (DUF2062 family)